ncbi:MAG: DNA polymerase III subunit delta [Micrococcales bacterium]|nr:DNA polymerase III subunit delta [Micrococcales bacterium]
MSERRSSARDGSEPGSPPDCAVPPFVLVSGPEEVLAQRALAATLEALRSLDPDTEVIRLAAAGYERGSLSHHASPSLFGGAKAIVVQDVEEAPDDLVTDLLAYLGGPLEEDSTLVVLLKGGNRGRKVLDAMKKAGARVLEAPAIKSDRDKSDFVSGEFRRHARRISPGAVRALVQAIGKDVSELASACAQLIADTDGTVDEGVVETYHGGRVEASGFRVADAAIAGNTAEALRLLRHAIAGGVDPVPIVAVLASQLRALVKVCGAGRGPSAQLAKSLGMAPWQVDRARRSLHGWDDDGLGVCIQAVAAADFDVKGGGRDPVYAVERAILTIAQARAVR